MTAQYLGISEYRMCFDNKSLILSENEICEIADYAIENDFKVSTNESLEKDNELLQEEIEELIEANTKLQQNFNKAELELMELTKEMV